MTEDEWLTGTDLRWLMGFAAEKVSRRKLLLFACALAETVAYDPATLGGQTLELVERYADGPLASAVVEEADLLSVRTQVQQQLRANPRVLGPDLRVAEQLLDAAMSADPVSLREEMLELLWECTRPRHHWVTQADVKGPLVPRLHDIAGNPFRPAAARPEWALWNGRQVPRLARALYDERRFNEVPYLADALEDAGCDDEVILRHLRGDGPHVRGCWALDLLLGLC